MISYFSVIGAPEEEVLAGWIMDVWSMFYWLMDEFMGFDCYVFDTGGRPPLLRL